MRVQNAIFKPRMVPTKTSTHLIAEWRNGRGIIPMFIYNSRTTIFQNTSHVRRKYVAVTTDYSRGGPLGLIIVAVCSVKSDQYADLLIKRQGA